jgi:hypothetical protein
VLIESFGVLLGGKIAKFPKKIAKFLGNLCQTFKTTNLRGNKILIIKGCRQALWLLFPPTTCMQTISGKKRTWNQLHALY